ncbi:MAG: F0F1 ATP synthase subunit A [Spirochaetaceae bacterium]|jgi:F-type H+-transporting ATPase subunit a|nr:F0F1 ATP synthase subunit A [Spirochaetaceae bacterium]
MNALEIKTIFTLRLFGYDIPITETVVVSWAVMLVLIAASLVLTRRLREIPRGAQAILEAGVEFLDGFAERNFHRWAKWFGPYIGTLFLFLAAANVVGFLTPVAVSVFGFHFEPPFEIKPPTRDINVTAALAVISILLVLAAGFLGRGLKGWFKGLLYPVPMMLPFNIMEYGIRPLSLCLRLFGNVLGAFILMHLITGLFPLALPMVFSLYFDFFDGLLQAVVFTFLTTLYISEALEMPGVSE